MERNIKNSFKLLSDIVEGLNKISDYGTLILDLNVSFCENKKSIHHFTLYQALDLIAKDCFKNNFADWSKADSAKVWMYNMIDEDGLDGLIKSLFEND